MNIWAGGVAGRPDSVVSGIVTPADGLEDGVAGVVVSVDVGVADGAAWQSGLVIVLVSNVTAPLRASSRLSNVAPV